MLADLSSSFWTKIDVAPTKREVLSLFPSTAKESLKTVDNKVIVATFATINELRLERPEVYELLSKSVSLVVVDEGHYEPAVEWGKSVKGLKTKTVLLTATPYRNDLKLFRIDPDSSTHHFTHKEAVDQKIIRQLQFTNLPSLPNIRSRADQFATAWKAARTAQLLPSGDPRAIVCCSNAIDIEEAVTRLRNAGLKAIGIHETFDSSYDQHLLKEVPDPQKTDSEVWVHQNKLTEGLDDHRFCAVALFTRIRNDRKLVQQIGRILRRDKHDRNVPAVLFSPPEFSPEAEWNAYLEFEPSLDLLKPQHFRDVVEAILKAQPDVEYFEGRFRRRFKPAELSKAPQVIVSPSVLVRWLGTDFSLVKYIEDCTDTLNTKDAVILGPDINGPCQQSATFALWVYSSVHNSRFLKDTSLYEIKLETHCVVIAEGLAFLSDTQGYFPEEYLEENTAKLGAEQLTRFLDQNFRPTHVSIDSAIPYDSVVRGAELRGHNLLSVAASLTDRVQICRSARGTAKNLGRRYIGMNNGRVRKEASAEERRSFDLTTFVKWAQDVARILNSNIAGSSFFKRYMPTCAPPPSPKPKTICLDFLRQDFALTLSDDTECHLKTSSAEIVETTSQSRVEHTCTFELEGPGITNESVSLRLEYQPAKRRFWFNKAAGASVRVSVESDDAPSVKSLAEFLNARQEIVLMGLERGEIVYQGREFYKIDYSYAESSLISLIRRPQSGPICSSEKGTADQIDAVKRTRATQFPQGSIFRAITDGLIDELFEADLVICDDLGTECADFVCANRGARQLALIHAKTGSGAKISASSFHDVVAQAMKNLVYLTVNAEVPKGVNNWWRNAKWNKTNISRLVEIASGSVKGG